MSCSKILSGDIPELIYEVIKYFKTDFSTLHSCILVNRLWCRLTIPLLWEDPFSNPAGNYNFIEIYLHNLSGDSKTKLSEYKINDNVSPSNTLFNYFKFIKNLNTLEFISSVEKWTAENLKFGNRYSNFICISLFKIFIENEIELDNLDIEISNSNLDDILELILQNINFIQNIKILNFYICNYSKNMVTKDRVTQIVNLQRNLKEILLDDNNFPLYQSLLLSDNSNCSNTLKMIIFYNVDFRNISNLDKIFEQLNGLESINIADCSSLNTSFIPQIINLTKPFKKLKSLFLKWRSQNDETLEILLQKSGDNLEGFGGSCQDFLFKRHLLDIMKYCKNIKFLDLHEIDNQTIYPVLNIIENIKQNLNYLSIGIVDYSYSNTYIECSSTILLNLGQILPSKLEYLNLCIFIKANDFEVFLKNIQDTFIKKLVIENLQSQDILPYVKKYIMKRKRIEQLAILTFGWMDLFNLKDEVKEFKSYDIKVRRHCDLSLDSYNKIKRIKNN
ncbi:uncharacterized protein OCT59_019073 [Rhizophagus irregularis]|uniref:F-box domain-containing protein n=2 Tax=Rhizophagus irregularis TaxID=588596 RepID=U9TJX3_RHIID|nr:hypothetical protein GLOIN_2v1777501 [Rhizophagus irregularis DAOM 181602=DAOM 197198]EXX78352.1 hypothetical protein RirG_015700 [Rhizophagus irregularis DAOM 197198w]POG69158.1 hypothetical protein GLOIN_2v1777501 [Rhizophagus irregularis DAOM 181602=DAOM 197198]UZO26860.1 hypothetical protein OCT59_019073 [Rhizophagus irregularis]GBC34043.1 hypothetical protein GLOIN_2v1777501 [Rhizophagus irregularis DAOM 181602=DAOM 197198]|eukprot:XP_025176024.1 hypothetical protein GLOIN_2v1777501 [Rhizophagus irregularis DAOM 181602=DAOM 197198]